MNMLWLYLKHIPKEKYLTSLTPRVAKVGENVTVLQCYTIIIIGGWGLQQYSLASSVVLSPGEVPL